MPRIYELKTYSYDELSVEARDNARQQIVGQFAKEANIEASDAAQEYAMELSGIPFGFNHTINVRITSEAHFILIWKMCGVHLGELGKILGIKGPPPNAYTDISYEYQHPGPAKVEFELQKWKDLAKAEERIGILKAAMDQEFNNIVDRVKKIQQKHFEEVEQLLGTHSYLEDGTIFLGMESIYKEWYYRTNPVIIKS